MAESPDFRPSQPSVCGLAVLECMARRIINPAIRPLSRPRLMLRRPPLRCRRMLTRERTGGLRLPDANAREANIFRSS